MGPMYPQTHSPGRGECAQRACETVTYVWSHNPAAWVGLVAGFLALWLWWREVRPSLEEAEEEEVDG